MPDPATDRLEQSRKVLTAWETMGLPSGIEGHLQLTTEMAATNTRTENRINSVQRPTAPNPLGYIFNGIGGGAG